MTVSHLASQDNSLGAPLSPGAPMAILTVAAVLSLGACASVDPVPVAAASGPAPVADFDWFHEAEADEAGLVYGQAETDNIWLGLSCRRNSGRLALLQPVGPGHEPVIRLESGGDTESYRAQAEESAIHEGLDLTGEASTRDPVFQRFRRLGWMATFGDQGERAMMAAHPESTDAIERFFAFCG